MICILPEGSCFYVDAYDNIIKVLTDWLTTSYLTLDISVRGDVVMKCYVFNNKIFISIYFLFIKKYPTFSILEPSSFSNTHVSIYNCYSTSFFKFIIKMYEKYSPVLCGKYIDNICTFNVIRCIILDKTAEEIE